MTTSSDPTETASIGGDNWSDVAEASRAAPGHPEYPIEAAERLARALGVDIDGMDVQSVSLNLSAGNWPQLVIRINPSLGLIDRLANALEDR